MKQSPWHDIYKNKKFFINTQEPSVLIKGIFFELPRASKILDLGCGQGRNSIFLAKQGHSIDAVDIVDLNFISTTEKEIQRKIKFIKSSVEQFLFLEDQYTVVILARVIQYINPQELDNLFEKSFKTLKNNGYLLISYVFHGGMFNRGEDEFKVIEKFSHPVSLIESLLLEKGFTVSISRGSSFTENVPFQEPIESFDIIAIKRQIA